MKTKRRGIKLAPGADPYICGYWSYSWGQERNPPTWSELFDDDYIKKWLRGYDDARKENIIRGLQTRKFN